MKSARMRHLAGSGRVVAMRRGGLLLVVALALAACAPRDASSPPPALGAPEAPSPIAASAARAAPAAPERPTLRCVLDTHGAASVVVRASAALGAATAFEGRDGEEGEIRRSLITRGAHGDETWYEIVTAQGHGYVAQGAVRDVRWEPALPGDAAAPAGREAHRIAHDIQFVETPDVESTGFARAAGVSGSGTGGDVMTINAGRPGERIDVTSFLASGRYTVVDFYSEHCGPCRALAPQLEAWAATSSSLAVRKVDVDRPGSNGIDWGSPLVDQYGIRSLPHVVLYGPNGSVVAEGHAALSRIRSLAKG